MADNEVLLQKFDALVDLSELARAKDQSQYGTDYTKVLNEMAEGFKVPYKAKERYRHEDICSTNEHQVGAGWYLLVAPGRKWSFMDRLLRKKTPRQGSPIKKLRGAVFVELDIIDLHEIRFHNGSFTPEQTWFLEEMISLEKL